MLRQQLQRLDKLLNQLTFAQTLTAASAAELLNSAMQMEGWPQVVSAVYSDATASPMLLTTCGAHRTHGEHPDFPLRIFRHTNGSMRVGLKNTPYELQQEIAPAPLSHLDALITSLRVINDGPAKDGLHLLLMNTGFALEDFHREVNAQGHPVGRYRSVLEGVKLNVTNVVMQRKLLINQALQRLEGRLQAQQAQQALPTQKAAETQQAPETQKAPQSQMAQQRPQLQALQPFQSVQPQPPQPLHQPWRT